MQDMNEAAIIAYDDVQIRDMIYTVRSKQVMLDSDLAELYKVETKALNRAAKRNEDRFPEDFRFRLTREELDNLRCQIGTLAGQDTDSSVGRTYLPHVYTEQGVAMLSGVLRSKVAVDTSVRIMRAFVEMRHFITDNAHLFEQIRTIDRRQVELQAKMGHRISNLERSTDERFERVFDYMEAHEAPNQKIFFEGQIYDAFELLVSLVQGAKCEIALIDGHVDTGTLNILAKKVPGVTATVRTHPRTSLTERDVATFNALYPTPEVKRTTSFHDRFLILDGTEGYLVGASLVAEGLTTR